MSSAYERKYHRTHVKAGYAAIPECGICQEKFAKMNEPALFYKIRNRRTGLFSKGGSYPRWSKLGKVWHSKGALSNHLALVSTSDDYKDAEIIECEFVEMGKIQIDEWLAEVSERRNKRNASREARYEAYRVAERRRQFEELAKEFGNK